MNNYDYYKMDAIRKDIARFKNDPNVNKLNTYYKTKSYSEILGVSRKELPHSRFLAWFFTPYETHGLNLFGIKKLVDIFVLFSSSVDVEDKKLFDSIITDDLEIENVKVEIEKSISKVGRLDIFIELDLINNPNTNKIQVVIENKVTASETSDQTSRYYDYFEKNKDDKTAVLYIYLTPISTLKLMELDEPQCTCKKFNQINYQTLVDLMFEAALSQDIPTKTKNILSEYLQSLSQPSFDENDEHQEGLIMAIGNEERGLLTKFWDNNQNLILASLYAMSSDPDQDKDVRDSITEALDKISDNTKDRSLIDIKYQGEVVVHKIKKSDIGLRTVQLLDEKSLIDEATFEFLKNDRSSSFYLLKTIDEMTDTEIKYRKYRANEEAELIYNEQNFYVARNWGIGNIGKFIDKIEEQFEDLTYIVN